MQRLADATRRRRNLSLTSLIDVIFLLLLFFMLSSTFTRFSELQIATVSGGAIASGTPPVFLRLALNEVTLNGVATEVDRLAAELAALEDAETLLISMSDDVTAQRLTDVLVVLRAVEGLAVTVLE